MPTPKTIKQITLEEFQEKVALPNQDQATPLTSCPKSKDFQPKEAFIPMTNAVFGLCISRKRKRRIKEVKQIGTLAQKHQCQERIVLKSILRNAPTELARTQRVLVRANTRVQLLLTINLGSNVATIQSGKLQTKQITQSNKCQLNQATSSSALYSSTSH
jgi:hypothetical protein